MNYINKLTDKRQAFVQAYCTNGHNASQAYKTAYPGCNGGWERLGHRLMTNDDVKQAISLKMTEIKAETDVEVTEIIKGLRLIAFGDNAKDADKLRALELLGKYKAIWIDRTQQDKPLERPELTPEDIERLKAQAKVLTKPKVKVHKCI